MQKVLPRSADETRRRQLPAQWMDAVLIAPRFRGDRCFLHLNIDQRCSADIEVHSLPRIMISLKRPVIVQ